MWFHHLKSKKKEFTSRVNASFFPSITTHIKHMTANEISETEEESDESRHWSIDRHRSVANGHGNEEVEIRGEAKGEVREESSRSS